MPLKTVWQMFSILLLFATATVAWAKQPHEILGFVLRDVFLEEARCEETLDFLRAKGTEQLREVTGNPSAILIFEYRFAPRNNKLVNFHKKNVSFGEVLLDVSAQLRLSYKMVGLDRIVIADLPERAKTK